MSISDFLASLYIRSKFLFRRARPDAEWTVVFARGAFRRDISSLSANTVLVNIGGEWLRRCLKLGVPDAWLEQVICLGYRDQLRAAFPMTIRALAEQLRGKRARLLYGGVDYFEVVLFADPSFYPPQTRIEAVFHENYANSYIKNATDALYGSIPKSHRIVFEHLWAYGPPAAEILTRYMGTVPQRMTMPRLAGMKDDAVFERRAQAIDDPQFARKVLLIAFPGQEYMAPICYVDVLLLLAMQGERGQIRTIAKFKVKSAARGSMRMLGPLRKHIDWVFDGSIEDLTWGCGYTVVFNSIALYEALLGPSIIIMPNFLDTLLDANLMQESPEAVRSLCGDMASVRFPNSPQEMRDMLGSMDTDQIRRAVSRERAQRKALVQRKFYL